MKNYFNTFKFQQKKDHNCNAKFAVCILTEMEII